MKKVLQGSLKYIFVFSLALFALVFFSLYTNNWDSIWNYGFSYSIAKGQIPYRDFTMIIPPFYNYLMSIGLIIFSHDNIVMLIEQALVITIAFHFLYKLYDYKAWVLIAVMCFPQFISFSLTYNTFLFFAFTILLYLEEKKKNDYLVGVILSILILTKYTVGVFFLIPSIIFYYKDKEKLLKRFIGLIIPCLIFLIYLIVSNSLIEFIDLCILGLIDFRSNNTLVRTIYFTLSIIGLIISLIVLIKDKKKILNWYVLFSFTIMIPNFSAYHFYSYNMFIGLLLISNLDKFNLSKRYIVSVSLTVILLLTSFYTIQIFDFKTKSLKLHPFKVHNFYYYFDTDDAKEHFLYVNKIYEDYKKMGDVYYLTPSCPIWMSVVHEEGTNYFTILNKGNYGYNGTKKMINKARKMKNTYFVIDTKHYYEDRYGSRSRFDQFDYEIVDDILKHSKLVENRGKYHIYYKEK